jgi:hypothetical protein
MLVSDLIERLQTLPPDLEIWKSADDEGNDFDPVSIAVVENAAHTYEARRNELSLIDQDDLDGWLPDEYRQVVVLW